MRFELLMRRLIGVVQQRGNLFVNPLGRPFTVILRAVHLVPQEDEFFILPEGARPQRLTHAPVADHRMRQLRRLLQIAAGARVILWSGSDSGSRTERMACPAS